MAVTEIVVHATPEEVYEVLCDRSRYGDWVVGTERTMAGRGSWPQPGSDLRYRIAGPLGFSDRTIAVAADEPEYLRLKTKAWFAPDADIVIELFAEGDDWTRIRLEERPSSSLINLLLGPLGHGLLGLRNAEALRRLQRLAEDRA
jgi:hypothetical protein